MIFLFIVKVYSSVNNPATYADPYSDPYNKYSGYTKQKGCYNTTVQIGTNRDGNVTVSRTSNRPPEDCSVMLCT